MQNKAFSEHIAKWRSGGLLFEALGWQLDDVSPMLYLRSEHPRFTVDSLALLERTVAQVRPAPQLAPAIVPSRPQEAMVPEAAVGAHTRPEQPTLTDMRVSKLRADKLIPIPERELAGFRRELRLIPAESLGGDPEPEVDESMFEVDSRDLRAMMGSLGGAPEGTAFKTKAWKELEQLEKMTAYEKTVIRVRFPDNSILQANFHPRERLEKLWAVVQESLVGEPAAWSGVWSLWNTWPAEPIAQDRLKLTFAREGMQPRALLDLKWDGAAVEFKPVV